MTEPAIEIEGLSKRYRGGGPLVPIPFRWGRRLERGRRMGDEHADYDLDAADDDVDDDVDDDDDFDDGDEFEERRTGARRETWALRDISVTIPAGARVALIGPDGSGKSTLVKILSGTAIPTSGRATIRGRLAPPVQTIPGLMQSSATGRDNVAHIADYQGISRREALSHVDEIAAFAELEDQIDNKVRTYSTNERQRLAFAIAIGMDPGLLLADEVVAVGDAHFRRRCVEEIERRSELGMALLLATHSMPLAERLCTEAILLDAGRIVEYGAVDEVVRRYLAVPRTSAPVKSIESPLSSDQDEPSVDEPTQSQLGVSAAVYSVTGRHADVLTIEEEALVEIALDVANAPATLGCLLGLVTPTQLLRSTQPTPFVVPEPGRRYVNVRIPPGALPAGSFRGRVTVFEYSERGRNVVGRDDSAFSLDVLEPRRDVRRQTPVAHPDQDRKRNLSLAWSVSEQ
jgi:ABC-type polysaccharide/polyol phosphate transport system ATPase subunit